MGIILRHPWAFFKTSIWGPRSYIKPSFVPQGGPAWSVVCSQGLEQTGGSGLRALIKPFFGVLAILNGLDLGEAPFLAKMLPFVSRKPNQAVNAAWKLQRAKWERLTFMGIILSHQ